MFKRTHIEYRLAKRAFKEALEKSGYREEISVDDIIVRGQIPIGYRCSYKAGSIDGIVYIGQVLVSVSLFEAALYVPQGTSSLANEFREQYFEVAKLTESLGSMGFAEALVVAIGELVRLPLVLADGIGTVLNGTEEVDVDGFIRGSMNLWAKICNIRRVSPSVRDLRNVYYGPPESLCNGQRGYRLQVYAGANITGTINEATSVALALDSLIEFEFNGVVVSVRGDSDAQLIYRDWHRALNGYTDEKVGPYPNRLLSVEELIHDAAVEAEHELERQARQREADKARQRHSWILDGALLMAPKSLTLRDEEGWKKSVEANKDGYGAAVIRYAEKWARLMEGRMEHGDTLENCADEASSIADDEGITGFMYGCAVSILSQCWIHGEQLRLWHNLKTQIGTEGEKANASGGVLNPALLSIG